MLRVLMNIIIRTLELLVFSCKGGVLARTPAVCRHALRFIAINGLVVSSRSNSMPGRPAHHHVRQGPPRRLRGPQRERERGGEAESWTESRG